MANYQCVSCDFRVYRVAGHIWKEGQGGVDYMFLRTNMPDFTKVESRLEQTMQPASAAWACQCSWTSFPGMHSEFDAARAVGKNKWMSC